MSVRAVGWTVSLGIAVAGAGLAAATALADDATRRKARDSALLLRDRTLGSAGHLRDRALQTAGELREQWTGTAVEVRDRWTETAGDWREKSSENIERRLRQAAEARDDSLASLPDDEES